MSNSDALRDALIREVHFRLYEECLPRILNCLDQLDDNQIWWRPNENSNSIGNLILHLCGNVRQWIYTGWDPMPDNRNRQSEFDERGPISRDELVSKLTDTMSTVKPVIENVPSMNY
jgi:hypothetical protein